MTDQDFESKRREQEERPPLDGRLHKAYVLLLEGAFHVTRLIQLAEELSEKKNESAIEVARSALVFAGACMDATIKQLIHDNLFPVSLFDSKVQQSLSKRIGRILKKDIADDAQELANLLIWGESAFSPFVERVVDDIVLQFPEH